MLVLTTNFKNNVVRQFRGFAFVFIYNIIAAILFFLFFLDALLVATNNNTRTS